MKKLNVLFNKTILILFSICLPLANLLAENQEEELNLDEVILKGNDLSRIKIHVSLPQLKLDKMLIDDIPIPEVDTAITVDLENTLPEDIMETDLKKPFEAIALLEYGLYNTLITDVSLYISKFNPAFSIKYKRYKQDDFIYGMMGNDFQEGYDDLEASVFLDLLPFYLQIYGNFYEIVNGLQDNSKFSNEKQRLFQMDVESGFKVKDIFDIGLTSQQDWYFNAFTSEEQNEREENIFYRLNLDLYYKQMFFNWHNFKASAGYVFRNSYAYNKDNDYHNHLKIQLRDGFSILEYLYLNLGLGYRHYFPNFDEPRWYLLPFARINFNYKSRFSSYMEGGGKLTEVLIGEYVSENNYTDFNTLLYPSITWYAKTGLNGKVTKLFSVFCDIFYGFVIDGHEWQITSDNRNLYSLKNRDEPYNNIQLSTGFQLNYSEILSFKLYWQGQLFDFRHYIPRHMFNFDLLLAYPKFGLNFECGAAYSILRTTVENITMDQMVLVKGKVKWQFYKHMAIVAEAHCGFSFDNDFTYLYWEYAIFDKYAQPGVFFAAGFELNF